MGAPPTGEVGSPGIGDFAAKARNRESLAPENPQKGGLRPPRNLQRKVAFRLGKKQAPETAVFPRNNWVGAIRASPRGEKIRKSGPENRRFPLENGVQGGAKSWRNLDQMVPGGMHFRKKPAKLRAPASLAELCSAFAQLLLSFA